jgi:biopolymer transport protein ExbB/TolQ
MSELDLAAAALRRGANWLAHWYFGTQPADRVAWGGLVGCAALAIGVLFERTIKLRQRRIVPPDFTARFLDRLHEGKLDCGTALDHCELNPSPAARIALAAVRRWGRPASDLERAVSLAHRVETDRLRRNVGTLRRIAVLAPLIGLLGTLFAVARALESIPPVVAPSSAAIESARGRIGDPSYEKGPAVAPSSAAIESARGRIGDPSYEKGPAIAPSSVAIEPAQAVAPAIAWGPALSGALGLLSAGIIIATLALVAYDGLQCRVEKLTASLDRVGAETIDAIALAAPISPPPVSLRGSPGKAAPAASLGDTDNIRRSAPTLHHPHVRPHDAANPSRRFDQQEAGF